MDRVFSEKKGRGKDSLIFVFLIDLTNSESAYLEFFYFKKNYL